MARLQNGIAKEIADKIKETCENFDKKLDCVNTKATNIKTDTGWLKWLYGSVGLIVVLAMVFVNVYWLSHRASTASAVAVAVEEKIEEYIEKNQGR